MDDDEKSQVLVKLEEEITLQFALKYLVNFAKGSSLSDTIILKMNSDVPLVVEYKIEELGSLRYYLAPKIEDAEENA